MCILLHVLEFFVKVFSFLWFAFYFAIAFHLCVLYFALFSLFVYLVIYLFFTVSPPFYLPPCYCKVNCDVMLNNV